MREAISGAEAEIAFSLSNTTLKLFSTLLVPPGLSTRVYLHFRAEPPSGISTSADPPSGISSSRELAYEIAVRCHSIKDYQEVIKLSASCHAPLLRLSHTQLDFSLSDPRAVLPDSAPNTNANSTTLVATAGGAPSAAASSASVATGVCATLNATNGEGGSAAASSPTTIIPPVVPATMIPPVVLALERILVSAVGLSPLHYTVRSSCCFFDVTTPAGGRGGTVPPAVSGAAEDENSHRIVVTPNASAIRQHASFLSRQRYLEEHFTVYNRHDLNEHECVTVRLGLYYIYIYVYIYIYMYVCIYIYRYLEERFTVYNRHDLNEHECVTVRLGLSG